VYCANNPINYTDPSGHAGIPRWILATCIDIVLAACTYGMFANVNTALKILKNEVLKKEGRLTKQAIARSTSKIKYKLKNIYYRYIHHALGKVKKNKIVMSMKKWLKNLHAYKLYKILLSNQGMNIITGEVKSSFVGNIVDRFVGHIKIYQTYEIFSSAGNFLAAVFEECIDKDLDGSIGA